MQALTSSFWEVLSWRSKSKYDSASDQYTRIFMPKVLVISSLIMGYSYFTDKLNCFVGDTLSGSKDFVQESCWTQGFYIYSEMDDMLHLSAFYGIPIHIEKDGLTYDGALCATVDKQIRDPKCRPMKRRYFLQYQWIPFYVLILPLLYLTPYLLYKFGNSDMISLIDTAQTIVAKEVDKLANNYFNYKVNSVLKMKLIIWFNIAVKIFYILANVAGFVFTDYVMDGRFLSYGTKWLKWNEYPNDVAHMIGAIEEPKPGDYLLPSIGICDVFELLKDSRSSKADQHKVVCEISQNVRYQYVFIILWFFFFLGVVISFLGFLQELLRIVKAIYWIYSPKHGRLSLSDCIHSQLTVREMEYLERIKSIDMTMYGELIRELARLKPGIHNIKKLGNVNGEMITFLPSAPSSGHHVV